MEKGKKYRVKFDRSLVRANKVLIPADKSIFHRALIIASTTDGTSTVSGIAPGRDVMSTADCLSALGVKIVRSGETDSPARELPIKFTLSGNRFEFTEPTADLYCGNSGTTARLLMGALASQKFRSTLTGDDSLLARPMRRVSDPLSKMGAVIRLTEDRLPAIVEPSVILGRELDDEIKSAQVKSAILLAHYFSGQPGSFQVKKYCRDHTERMLSAVGCEIVYEETGDSAEEQSHISRMHRIKFRPVSSPRSIDINVPGDFSSAMFFAIPSYALDLPLRFEFLGNNPSRTSGLSKLVEAGFKYSVFKPDYRGPEPFGDLDLRPPLKLENIVSGPDESGMLIDEFPCLAMLSLLADGKSRFDGVSELRVKESDRLEAICRLVRFCGGSCVADHDSIEIEPPKKISLSGESFDCGLDHRVEMAAVMCAMFSPEGLVLSGAGMADISNPLFFDEMVKFGFSFQEVA